MKVILVVLYILLGIAQIAAYLKDINLWLGIGKVLGLVIFFGTAWLPFGSVIDALIGFYGAYKGWPWEWWQAALLTFPFAIVGLIISSLGWIVDLFHEGGNFECSADDAIQPLCRFSQNLRINVWSLRCTYS